ncbi:pirin-like protein [Artemisia annua]|uniref:Pirin-like protein n=1 Tax=Artemisia annua TaxID=35608 RepID=A0A2U1P7D8_ARTAN|nr:pirin-like protein [Artemisia annua]
MGVKSPVFTATPSMFLDFTISPGAQMHQSIPETWNSFVYVLEGEGLFGSMDSSPISAHHVLVLTHGDGLSVWNNGSKPLRFVLIGGQPINEPVVKYGPFVMNTQAEIQQALKDYHYCKNGPGLKSVDPFIILDEFSTGFQIVTYMLEGALRYKDSTGIWGATIPEGCVQWVTAGRGLFFSQVPACPGTHKGLQIWINLPSKDKMVEPDYNVSQTIECAEKDGVKVRIIEGESMGVKSEQGYTRTPIMFLDFTLNPGAQMNQPIPESWNSFVYVLEGEGLFGSMDSSPILAHHVLVLSHGDGLSVWNNGSKPLRFVLIGGQPLNEPVVWLGEDFVMNTEIEVEQAYQDLSDCKNGFEMAEEWKIK